MNEICSIKPSPIKTVGKLKLTLQKYNPLPIKNAVVRYDTSCSKWALMDDKLNVKQHFEMGVMENVQFSSKETHQYHGCGPTTSTIVGLATGDLYLHKSANESAGIHNLMFDGHSFKDDRGLIVTNANKIALFPGRKALLID